ncbi:sigma-70 family RNA polymerase sigma factor [Fulvivirgaceae bacterium BMA10]|uniref:Sigma-70 family RNA polymerase sigma factor n=1 Tax=Splendidivirga corallicola TaxID=3051826 RepID=A0ABT8KKW0_9BACT|nr:sigma-70 family RNA polymerase sigma factor [Fulvivirgaceae bacterium BMA10]
MTKPHETCYLVEAIKNENNVIIKQYYNQCFERVQKYVLKNNGSKTEAKDLYQDAWLHLFSNIKQNRYRCENKTCSYLFKLCKFRWLDDLRKRKVQRQNEQKVRLALYEQTIWTSISEDSWKKILNEIKNLSGKCYEILDLFYNKKYSMKQIAEILGYKDAHTVRSTKERCMKSLKEKIKKFLK